MGLYWIRALSHPSMSPDLPADPSTDSQSLLRRVVGTEPMHYQEIGQIEAAAATLQRWPALGLLRGLASAAAGRT